MTPEQEAEWLERRRQGIGASDAARIWTGSYGGVYGVVADKIGFVANEIDPALADRGHRWERPIADAIRALTGYYVHGEQMHIASAENPLHMATVDGLLDPAPQTTLDAAEAVLEIKTRGAVAKPNWPYYLAQTQWQMHVTGKARAVIALATIDDVDDTCLGIEIRPVERDDFLIEQLIEAAAEAWGYVERGELPEPDDSTDVKMVREIHGLADKAEPSPPIEDMHDDLGRWLQLKAAVKAASDELNGIECRIRDRMGMATSSEDERYRVRIGEPQWRFTDESERLLLDHLATLAAEDAAQFITVRLDRKAVQAERPDLWKEFQQPTTIRTLTVKDKTE